MSKSLDALERLYCAGRLDLNYVQSQKHKQDYEIIEKELKALEIIKNKKVNVLELSVCANYETFISFFKQWNWNGEYDEYMVTQEEYDLLREALL